MSTKRKPASQSADPRSADVATNRRAGHKFELLDRFECGIELLGTEVKSLREGKAQLGDAYAAIERDADRVCASFLLGRELFESGWKRSFEGEVSGVIGAGAFVRFGGELGDVYEGLLPVRLLREERFDLNQTETALVGRRSGRALRLGDPITVRVDSIDAPRGRVDLVADDGNEH